MSEGMGTFIVALLCVIAGCGLGILIGIDDIQRELRKLNERKP